MTNTDGNIQEAKGHLNKLMNITRTFLFIKNFDLYNKAVK